MNGIKEDGQSFTDIPAFKELKNMIVEEFGSDAPNDGKINRFLIARDYDVKQAYTMLKKEILWRKNGKVDTILDDYHPREVFEKYFTISAIGFSKENFLVILANFGTSDLKGFCRSATRDEINRHIVYVLEGYHQQVKEYSKKVGLATNPYFMIVVGDFRDFPSKLGIEVPQRYLGIINMEGLQLSQFTSKAVFEQGIEYTSINDNYYPETLEAVYIINASSIVQILCSIFKPFIATKTFQKAKFFGKDCWKEELLKIINAEVLPAYLGGKRTDPDGNPMCHSIINHGGPIPDKFYMNNEAKPRLKYENEVKSHVLKRRSKFHIFLEVKIEGSFIEWEFEIDNHDIGFGLFYKISDSDEEDLEPLIPLRKSNSFLLREVGTYKCEKSGIYVLTLDNSYSYFRSKTIYYKASVVKANERTG